jgi:hypothetical protein
MKDMWLSVTEWAKINGKTRQAAHLQIKSGCVNYIEIAGRKFVLVSEPWPKRKGKKGDKR